MTFCRSTGLGLHVEFTWMTPEVAEFSARLASVSRLISFDRRGVGASDALPRNAIPTWEDFTEDAGAVLDAVGSRPPVERFIQPRTAAG